jgi:hypothetical protein
VLTPSAETWVMPALTRRRNHQAQSETWRILYDEADVGMIGIRAGGPYEADQWQWRCGLSRRGRRDRVATILDRLLKQIRRPDLSRLRLR